MADADDNEKSCCQNFCDGLSSFSNFLYNKESGLVLGRTGKSWAKIGFFYLIFYGFLAGFFSGMLAVFLSTLNNPDDGLGPKLTQFVENQPGLTRIGKLDLQYNKTAGSDDINNYVNSVTEYFKKFDAITKKCATNETGMPENEDCSFDTSLLKDCKDVRKSLEDGFPCVFVKINKVYGWVPKSNDGDGFLTLSCSAGATVFPKGFQISGFPFRGQKNFELPIVAVKFNRTKYKKVDCVLQGQGIQISESFVPHRAFGKIRIN